MVEKQKIRSKVKPREIVSPLQKPGTGIHSDPIFRLAQNSRRIPPSSFITQRKSSIFLSVARVIGEVWDAWSSRRSRKRNLYEELANTMAAIEKGTQESDKKLLALKGSIENRHKATKMTDDNS
jgi:hypothetical protein